MPRLVRNVCLMGVVAVVGVFPLSLAGQRSVAVTLSTSVQRAALALDGPERTAAFVVANTGTQDEVYGLACGPSGVVTSCKIADGIVRLAAGQTANVSAAYSVGGVGTGLLTLKATSFDGVVEDQVEHTVELLAPASVSVTPDGTAAVERAPNSGVFAEVFTVQNTGGIAQTFELICGQSGSVTCEGTSEPTVTLSPRGTAQVTATYSTGAPGLGAVTLTARSLEDSNLSEGGAYNIRVVSQ